MIQNKIQSNKNKIITFIIISYAISWIIWMPNVLAHNFNFGWSHSNWLHIFGGLGPFFGAIITTLIYDKSQGIKKYFKERFFKIPDQKWLMVGLLMPIVFFFIAYLGVGLFTGEWTNLSLIGLNSKVPITSILLIWLLWCLFYGIGEEGGWRGFLMPELTQKYQTRISTFYTALIWAPWHLPIFFYDKDFIAMGVGGSIGWVVGLIFGSLLLGWLAKQSNWSLWPVILWHGTFNLFTTSDKINPMYPALMSMMVIMIVLWIARRYGENLDINSKKNKIFN